MKKGGVSMFNELLQQTYFNNTLQSYVHMTLTFIVSLVFILILKRIVLGRLARLAERTKNRMDDLLVLHLGKSLNLLGVVIAAIFSLKWLTLSAQVSRAMNAVSLALVLVVLIRFVMDALTYMLETFWLKGQEDFAKKQSMTGILTMVKILVWGLALVFFLDNLGFKVSSVVAGLGIGGVAVALAAQAVLGDLFSYIAIFFDRPFEIGDFIIVGDYLGGVEHIGIKTTRIRSLGGEQLVFSNSDLTNSRVRNYKRMEKRRVVFKLGVTYDTSSEKLQAIPGLIEQIVKQTPETIFDRAHFSEYGDFNLVIEAVYYVLSSDYNQYMDIQQAINLAIKKSFEKEAIEFAFPTQTVYVNQPAG